ncbi:protein kinase domain-containing protein [Nocardioides sp. Soil805]|uniref:protein kinase domain-containing protein n=1 Tax=Nocardioides sp. Soil805 TaxID=1736416 RepID=UPI000703181E|nr:protein kinase [Nocardioides sp. Soil805]KRF32297.1 hypothetical protein ASG94_17625 [Nocardioides sp. Soil805]
MSAERVLCGRYEVGEVIGRGGMADVHLGRDRRSGRRVAIKMLRKKLAEDPVLRTSLQREAQTLRRLHHRGIVALHNAGQDEVRDGSGEEHAAPFIVMEYVAGRSLRELLGMGRLSLAKSIHYQVGVLRALEAIHRAGVVHRDIKPANVMVTSRGAVKLVDFGIARPSDDPAATVSDVEMLLGTPRYLSPEQARGETADARSDLYSAGCLLFELLLGRPPFAGDDPIALAYQHVHEPLPRTDTGIPALDAVVVRALAKRPDERFQDARAFRDALQSATKHVAPHRDSTTDHTARQREGSTPWDSSPSEKRTAPRSSSTTRTRARDSRSSSSTDTR